MKMMIFYVQIRTYGIVYEDGEAYRAPGTRNNLKTLNDVWGDTGKLIDFG